MISWGISEAVFQAAFDLTGAERFGHVNINRAGFRNDGAEISYPGQKHHDFEWSSRTMQV